MIHFAKEVKSFTLGPLNPSIKFFHWLECILNKHLPSNAHQLANGRLAVTMTRLTDGEQILMSDFDSKEDVVQVRLLRNKKSKKQSLITMLTKNCCVLCSGTAL